MAEESSADEKDLVQQGIDAYEAGDIETAHDLLSRAIEADPEDDRAWFNLSRTQSDPDAACQSLEKALEINPENSEARDSLNLLKLASPAKPDADDDEEEPAEARYNIPPDVDPTAPGITLPEGIPGAPSRITAEYLSQFYDEAARSGISIATDDAFAIDLNKASWWNIILMATSIGLLTGVVILVRIMLLDIRALNLFSLVSQPLMYAAFAPVAVGVGCYLSHWYVRTQQGVKISLLEHSYTLTMVWFPASVVNTLMLVLEWLFNQGVLTLERFIAGGIFFINGNMILLTLMAAGITAYTLYLMKNQLARLYTVRLDDRQLYITAAIMLVVTDFLFDPF